MSDFHDTSLKTELLRDLASGVREGDLFLVGGAIRNALLSLPLCDYDFTSPADPTSTAKSFASRHGGHWFWLDESRAQSRVIIDSNTFDFTPFRAATLEQDLAARDFTINAMALDLSGPCTLTSLIDPLDGRQDLDGRILRHAGPGVLRDDPLRILKGVRHAAELGLDIDTETLREMRNASGRLSECAPERLRLELLRILDAPDVHRGMECLEGSGAGAALLGGKQFEVRRGAVLREWLRVNRFLAAVAQTTSQVEEWSSDVVEQGMSRATLLRWCAVLRAISSELPSELARHWRFSRRAISRIDAISAIQVNIWPEVTRLPRRARSVALWALQYGPDPVDTLLASGLLQADPIVGVEMLKELFPLLSELPSPVSLPHLVNGHWLVSELGIKDETVGEVLAEVRKAEISGTVIDSDDARRFLLQRFRKNS